MNDLLNKILEELRGTWRFRVYAMMIAWTVCLLGWAVVATLPNMYESSARIFVDTRTALAPVLQGLTIQQDVNAQLNLVRQSLLSRPQLEKIARQADIDLRATTPEDRVALLDELGNGIQVRVSEAGGGAVYTVTYQDPQRATSLRVVQLLLDTFVEDTLGGKRVGAEAAQKFLREQIEEREQRLREAEERMADFKKRNVALMPGMQGDYFSRLQAEMANVEKAQASLAVTTTRRDELVRQLRGEAADAAVQASSAGPADLRDTASRIREVQARLEELLLQYTDRHPDVVALRETLSQLQERQSTEVEALRRGGGTLSASAAASPVVQKIQQSLNETNVEIATLRSQIADGQKKVAQLRNLVDTAPEVEAEFARLNRDYDVTRKQYTELVERSERARLGDQAEASGSVRFEIIDPPASKLEPVAPNRAVLMAGILVVGLGAGCGLAFLFHQLRPVFTSPQSLNEITGLPVLGVVSMTWLDKYRSRQRRELIKYAVGATALLAVFVIALQFSDAAARLAQQLVG